MWLVRFASSTSGGSWEQWPFFVLFFCLLLWFLLFLISPTIWVGSKKIELPNWVAQLQVRPVTTMRNRYIVLLAVYNCQPSLCFFNVCAFIFFY